MLPAPSRAVAASARYPRFMGDDPVEQLRAGKAFVDLSFWRKISVGGSEALSWLDALVTADLADLGPGMARRTLLLSPTGRVRAEFTAATLGAAIVLIQDPAQPRSILDLLSPYVLSSDVNLEDRTDALSVFAVPGQTSPPDVPGATSWTPSCLGVGVDVVSPGEDHDSHVRLLSRSLAAAGGEDLEAWRILTGRPRVGVDVLEEDLPKEGGLEEAVSFDKGCFTGQEAVAKVRNLGHPRRVILQFEAEGALSPGEPLLADGEEVGQITSATRRGDGGIALGRVTWAAREGPFHTGIGAPLRVLRSI
jgi:folate-binding protein YgfZ